MVLPFKMLLETPIEQWRHDTFWDKEPETIEWIRSFESGGTFFDIGANIGVYSLFCASIHPDCQIVSFEPHNGNIMRLIDNKNLNGFKNIRAEQMIISDDRSRSEFIEKSSEVGSSGSQMADGGSFNTFSISFLVYFAFNYPIPNYVKIDIDGQELRVVQGMRETLKEKCLKSVLVEADPGSKEQIVQIFIENGFTDDNQFNKLQNHSNVRRQKEGIPVENIIFTRA